MKKKTSGTPPALAWVGGSLPPHGQNNFDLTMRIPAGTRKFYDQFATAWTEEAKDVVNLRFDGVVDLIKIEDPESSPGLNYATPRHLVEVFTKNSMEGSEELSLALSVMLYTPNEYWREGDYVRVRTCEFGRRNLKRVRITRDLLLAHNADVQSVRRGFTTTISDDVYGYCYKRGKRNSIFVACHSVLISEGMVICCRCVYRTLERNVHTNQMDVRTQRALRSVITRRSWYFSTSTVIKTSILYILFLLTMLSFSVLVQLKQYEVAVSVLIPGLTGCYYALLWIAGIKDTGVTNALTFRGSEESVTSHINMCFGNPGRKIMGKGREGKEDLLVGTFVVQDKRIEKSILRFVSAAMCTAKMKEVLRPANSCALGSNVGVKTAWNIVMTSRRLRNIGCLLTNKFYVVHTASGLKAFEVTSVSTTARYTKWKEVDQEMAGVIELDHVILG